MSRIGGTVPVRVLLACLAVLLPAGAWSAAALDPGGPRTIAAGGQAGATGLSHTELLDEGAPVTSTAVTVAPAAVPTTAAAGPAASTTTKPSGKSATTTTKAPATNATTATLPPGVPPPVFPTKIPNIPPATSWNVAYQGITAHMWIDPATPLAGQTVRFHIDYSSAEPCCTIMLEFGDGSGGYGLDTSRTCTEPSPFSPGPHSVVTSHTYAAAGAYKAQLTVMAKDFCLQPPPAPGSPPPPPDLDAVSTPACIAVGPGTAGQKGCSPFPPFGPDTLVSPVIDPFCQVRSDCTQASTPRPGWDA
jgi:hypothetical protein